MSCLLKVSAVCGISLLALGAGASPTVSDDLVRARKLFFGPEHVDGRTGQVDRELVIFSWATNATLAVSIRGRVVLLDTYVHRAESAPGRTPFVVEDLLGLRPEAIFLGHGHFDHADNAAFLAGKLGIPVFASAETCIDLQIDAMALHGAGVLASGSIDCRPVTTFGSVPGAEVVTIDALEPLVAITAFRHLHSGTSYPETDFPITPVKNEADPRDVFMYPPGVAHSYPASRGPGGPVSIYYQFVLRGEHHFTFVWHNTTGDLKNGCTIDRGVPDCWGPAVGQQVAARIRALPETDLEFGSCVSLGYAVNGMRDPIQYSAALKPKVYIPIHQTNAALPTSSLWFKVAYLRQLDQMVPSLTAAERPEPRWMVDPDDYLKPLVFDPRDERWRKRSHEPGHHH